jgi:hypothetical protein
LVFIFIGLKGVLAGDFLAFFFLGVALFCFVFGKFSEVLDRIEFAVLYTDRVELPGFRDSREVFHWENVSSLRWPSDSSDNKSLCISTKEIKKPFGEVVLNLSNLSSEDMLVFVRYVRRCAVDIEQKRWPQFCRKIAVPLVDKLELQKASENQKDDQPLSLGEKLVVNSLGLCTSHPIIAGLLAPLGIVPILALVMRRRTCWMIAALVAISSFLNIRLMWGQWLEPFTTICLGSAAVFFLLGFVAIAKEPEPDTPKFVSTKIVVSCFALSLIGGPFAANALAKGWIPGDFSKPLMWLIIITIHAPIIIIMSRRTHHEKQVKDEREQEALERWKEFERRETVGIV